MAWAISQVEVVPVMNCSCSGVVFAVSVMKPSMLANLAVVAFATLANSVAAPLELVDQPSHPECAESTKL
jgi:hypothetical protein